MNKIKWKYEKRNINELQENKYNPRRMSKQKAKALKDSLKEHGQCKPIVITQDGKILGGHQRIRILRTMGVTEVDVSIPEKKLTREEEDSISIRLNKVQGDFDDELLANHFDPELLLKTGFIQSELDGYISNESKSKNFSISIKCETEEDLRHIESKLCEILMDFTTAKMKVRCK